jgi:hypothetical protein
VRNRACQRHALPIMDAYVVQGEGGSLSRPKNHAGAERFAARSRACQRMMDAHVLQRGRAGVSPAPKDHAGAERFAVRSRACRRMMDAHVLQRGRAGVSPAP